VDAHAPEQIRQIPGGGRRSPAARASRLDPTRPAPQRATRSKAGNVKARHRRVIISKTKQAKDHMSADGHSLTSRRMTSGAT
jgi:hypothetical protein